MTKEKILKRLNENIKYDREFLNISPNIKEWKEELKFHIEIRKIVKKYFKNLADCPKI